ncbi:hypothetical protein MTO96_026848 [Rhipicephalus appendiculatus]
MQYALNHTVAYLASIGLTVSAPRTEALLMSPQIAAGRSAARLRLNRVLLPWRTSVTYLGLRIDHMLTWVPATKVLLAKTTQARRAVHRIQARSNGCSTRWAL